MPPKPQRSPSTLLSHRSVRRSATIRWEKTRRTVATKAQHSHKNHPNHCDLQWARNWKVAKEESHRRRNTSGAADITSVRTSSDTRCARTNRAPTPCKLLEPSKWQINSVFILRLVHLLHIHTEYHSMHSSCLLTTDTTAATQALQGHVVFL